MQAGFKSLHGDWELAANFPFNFLCRVTSAMEDLIGLGNAGSNINVTIQVLSEHKSQKDNRLQ